MNDRDGQPLSNAPGGAGPSGSPPPPAAARSRRTWWVVLGWIAFPVLVWAVSTLWFGGATGKMTDDWSLSLRDPVTGLAPSPFNPWRRYPYFWRPLHIGMIFTVGTFAFENIRPVGLFVAAAHAWAAWSLFRLLRLGTSTRGAPALGALLWMAHPMHYEVSLWFCSTCTAIATALACELVRWQANRMQSQSRSAGALAMLGVFVWALAVPGFYEQPTAAIAAAPLVLWAAFITRERGSDAGGRAGGRAAIARTARLVAPAWLAVGVYVALMVATAPTNVRGGEGSFTRLADAGDRLAAVAGSVNSQVLGERLGQVVRGAWMTGFTALESGPGLALIVAIGAAGLAWGMLAAFATGRAMQSTEPAASDWVPIGMPIAARVLWVSAGVVMFVLGMVPVAMLSRQNVEPRTLYFPLAGLAVVLAQLFDVLLAPRARGAAGFERVMRVVRGVVSLAAVTAIVAACVCAVGVQEWQRRRSSADESIVAQLRALVPEPPPRCVFVPVRVSYTPTRTGEGLFDHLRPSVLTAAWAGTSMLRDGYRRSDVEMLAWSPWASPPVLAANERGLLWARPRAGGVEQARWLDAGSIVPFVVDARGRVVLVERVSVEAASGQVTRVVSPVARERKRADPALPTTNDWLVVPLRATSSAGDDSCEWLEPWGQTGQHILRPVRVWGQVYPAHFQVAVPYLDSERRGGYVAFEYTLASAVEPRRLTIRATIAPESLEWYKHSPVSAVKVQIEDGNTGQQLGVIRLEPKEIERARRWMTASIPIEVHAEVRRIAVRILCEPEQGFSTTGMPPVIVSAAALYPGLKDAPPAAPEKPVEPADADE